MSDVTKMTEPAMPTKDEVIANLSAEVERLTKVEQSFKEHLAAEMRRGLDERLSRSQDGVDVEGLARKICEALAATKSNTHWMETVRTMLRSAISSAAGAPLEAKGAGE